MANKVSLDALDKEVKALLDEYAAECAGEVNKAALASAQKCRDTLRKTSPKRTGKYARGWNVKTEENKINGLYTSMVYNKDKPQLTHLLENGHAKRNGGRWNGIAHIKPAETAAVKDFENRVKEVLGNG